MAAFDYCAPAELFPTRRRPPGRQSFAYKRFAQASHAVRFAIEDLPAACLIGAFLEVDEQRYGRDDIRRLYESAEYPLARRRPRSRPTRRSISTSIAGWRRKRRPSFAGCWRTWRRMRRHCVFDKRNWNPTCWRRRQRVGMRLPKRLVTSSICLARHWLRRTRAGAS
jgi:hypothetical protein